MKIFYGAPGWLLHRLSFQQLISAQVMISWIVILSPTSSFVDLLGILSLHLSVPLPHSPPFSLSQNKYTLKKKRKYPRLNFDRRYKARGVDFSVFLSKTCQTTVSFNHTCHERVEVQEAERGRKLEFRESLACSKYAGKRIGGMCFPSLQPSCRVLLGKPLLRPLERG